MTPVSIVIPTFNGASTLPRVLDAIDRQAGEVRPHVVAVDSGSTDGTLDVLARHGAEIVRLAPGTFNHGTSRNEGLSRARGAFAVLLVQDAVPASPEWLEALVEPLRRHDRIAGSFARQLPHDGASRLTSHYLSMWAAASHDPRIAEPITAAEFARLSPPERHRACAFDNVCSCLRVSVWRQHKFRPTPIAEDLEWARDVLLAGHALAYAPGACVWHSHERSAGYELKRAYLVHERLQALFGLSTIPTVTSLVRAIATTVPAHVSITGRETRGRGRAIARGLAMAVALPLGQYLGARAAREGRTLLRTGGV